MKTIYIKKKRSGNCKFGAKDDYTYKFKTKKDFEKWFNSFYRFGYYKFIKATYRLSQTYYYSTEFEQLWKKAKEIYK